MILFYFHKIFLLILDNFVKIYMCNVIDDLFSILV